MILSKTYLFNRFEYIFPVIPLVYSRNDFQNMDTQTSDYSLINDRESGGTLGYSRSL